MMRCRPAAGYPNVKDGTRSVLAIPSPSLVPPRHSTLPVSAAPARACFHAWPSRRRQMTKQQPTHAAIPQVMPSANTAARPARPTTTAAVLAVCGAAAPAAPARTTGTCQPQCSASPPARVLHA